MLCRFLLRVACVSCCLLAFTAAAEVVDVFAPRVHSSEAEDWAMLPPSMSQLLGEASDALGGSRYYRPSPRGAVPQDAKALPRDAADWKTSRLAQAGARMSMQVQGEGMHRQLQVFVKIHDVAKAVDLFVLLYLPRSCYVDTYELTNRHDYGVDATSTVLHTYRSSVDVEAPALMGSSLAVGLEFQQIEPLRDGSVRLTFTLPIHIRYLRPSGAEDAQPEETKVTLWPPLVFAREHTAHKGTAMHPTAPQFRHVYHESHLGRTLARAHDDISGYRHVNARSDKNRLVLHYLRGDIRHKWLSLIGTFIVSVGSLGAIVHYMLR